MQPISLTSLESLFKEMAEAYFYTWAMPSEICENIADSFVEEIFEGETRQLNVHEINQKVSGSSIGGTLSDIIFSVTRSEDMCEKFLDDQANFKEGLMRGVYNLLDRPFPQPAHKLEKTIRVLGFRKVISDKAKRFLEAHVEVTEILDDVIDRYLEQMFGDCSHCNKWTLTVSHFEQGGYIQNHHQALYESLKTIAGEQVANTIADRDYVDFGQKIERLAKCMFAMGPYGTSFKFIKAR